MQNAALRKAKSRQAMRDNDSIHVFSVLTNTPTNINTRNLSTTNTTTITNQSTTRRTMRSSTLNQRQQPAVVIQPIDEDQKEKSILEFEKRIHGMFHFVCKNCKSCYLVFSQQRGNECNVCYRKPSLWGLENSALPIWYKDNEPQFHVPPELEDLKFGEKLLIQQATPYVPLVHIKNGTMGIRGHVCCFPSAIDTVCKILPRYPTELKLLKVVRSYQNNNNESSKRIFTIRKDRVLEALYWLKRYNSVYQDIQIDESRLDWIGDDNKGHLDDYIESTEINGDEEADEPYDLGCSPQQCLDPQDTSFIESTGVVQDSNNYEKSTQNKEIHQCLNKATLDLPTQEPIALSEYSNHKIFCMTFPWLFPGGIGDFNDVRNEEIKSALDWAKHLCLYFDARFARDDLWCFYANNFAMRRRCTDQGHYYVRNTMSKHKNTSAQNNNSDGTNNGNKDSASTTNDDNREYQVPTSVEEIKEQLKRGNTQFLNKMIYFAKNITGSNAYWRSKRDELYSWINYHIDKKNGPPNLFITLSCAEFLWKDVRKLIKERVKIATGKEPVIDENTSFTKLVNEYTIVIQELFVMKVKAFLDTVGAKKFNIKHYWVRFEFAKARGQIHAHLLAITGKEPDGYSIQEKLTRLQGDEPEQVKVLSAWARDRLGLTAIHPATFDFSGELDKLNVMKPEGFASPDDSALRQSYTETECLKTSRTSLVNTAMMHKCSEYCLREHKRKKPEDTGDDNTPRKRYCRAGFGYERTKGSYDTPGHEMIESDRFIQDVRKYRQLALKRNSCRMLQTSMIALDAWRANCDVKIMVYDTDPVNPDLTELARVTDYVVAYTCKGSTSLQTEKDQVRDMILS